MGERNGEDLPPMVGYRRHQRDVLEDDTDVTHQSDRDLLLRAVNSTIATEHAVGQVLGELGGLRSDVDEIKRRLAPNGEIEHRAKMASMSTISESIASQLVEAVQDTRDGRGNITPARVNEILEQTLDKRELASVQRGRDARRRVIEGVAIGVIVAALAWLGGHLEGRATAPQQAQGQTR